MHEMPYRRSENFFSGKDGTIVATIKLIVGNMLNNHGSFLLFDEFHYLRDKLLWIVLKHIEFISSQSLQNCCNCFTGQNSTLSNLANKVIFDLTGLSVFQCLCSGLFASEGSTRLISCSFISVFWRPIVVVYCSSETNSFSLMWSTALRISSSLSNSTV